MAETKSKSTRTTKSSAAGKPAAEKATPVKRSTAAAAKPKSASLAAKAEKPKAAAKLRTTTQSAAATVKKKGNGDISITPEQRYRMISDAAYYRAQRRGFVGGNPAEDWYAAESEVDELIHSMRH